MYNRESGFTLVEMMIAMLIIAILAAVVYPAYKDQIMKVRRDDGRAALLNITNQLRTHYSLNLSYVKSLTDLGYPSDTTTSKGEYYSISYRAGKDINFTDCHNTKASPCLYFELIAEPAQGSTQTQDLSCQLMELSQLGEKYAEDNLGQDSSAICW